LRLHPAPSKLLKVGKKRRPHSDRLPGANALVDVLEDTQGFALIKDEWEDLYRCSADVTPFQSWAWLYSWWELYGEGYELRLITMRNDEGLLIGIIPLMLERRRGFGRLLFVGTGPTDYLDALVKDGWEEVVFEAGARALERIGSWSVADLQQLRPNATAWGFFRRWEGPGSYVRQDGCPVVEAKSWDELLVSRSTTLRSTARRSVRRAEADGVYRRIVSVADAEQAARRLVALHRESWQGRHIEPEHLTQRFESLIVAAARRMTAHGSGGISEFWRDGEVIISHFILFGRDHVETHTMGASQKALQRYQWSSLYIWDAVEVAGSRNKGYVDLLRGEEPYKLRWSSEIIPTHRLLLGRRRAVWAPYAGYHALRSKARWYAKSEDAPQWVKSARARYRKVRYKVAHYVSNKRGKADDHP